jgi:hypothetical protein
MRSHDLLPPYTSLIPSEGGYPPLGTVRLLDGSSPANVSADVRELAVTMPWAIPCAVLRSFTPDLLLDTVPDRLLRRTAIISVTPPGSPPSAFGVLQAVVARPLPTARDVAGYVVDRLDRDDAREALVAAMEGDDAAMRPASVWRVLDGLGRLKLHEWRRLLWLVEVAAGAWVNRQDSVDDSLSFWTGVLLEQSPRALRQCIGWEWVVERALRVAGYVEDPELPLGGSHRDSPLIGPLAPTWHHRTIVSSPSGCHLVMRR